MSTHVHHVNRFESFKPHKRFGPPQGHETVADKQTIPWTKRDIAKLRAPNVEFDAEWWQPW